MPVRYHASYAWLGDAVAADVLIEVSGELFTSVTAGVPAPPDADEWKDKTGKLDQLVR